MTLNPKLKKLLSLVLCLMLILPSTLAADNNKDYQDHFAKDSIENLFEKGFVKGYEDGSFKPDREISRAEFMTIINRAFDFKEKAEISFKDVKLEDWHYEHIARAVKAGYIKGFVDGTMRPTQNITRQEAAVIIARILELEEEADPMILASLADADKIQEWSAKGIAAILSKDYISRSKDNAFEPTKALTRGEMAIAIDKSYIKAIKQVYAKPGLFKGGEIDGSVKIDNAGITLMDTVINGDLILDKGIGEGDVHLINLVVKGDTIVKGGGEATITLTNCQLSKIIIIKEGNKIRVLVKGKTSIGETEVRTGGILESEGKAGEGFGLVTIAEELDEDAIVQLIGNFESVEIRAKGVNVQASGGTIGNMEVAETAANVNIELAKDSKVETLVADAAVAVEGEGKIVTAELNESGSKLDVVVDKVEAAKGVKYEAPKEKVVAGTTPSKSGGGSKTSGGDTQTKTVSAISVEGDVKVGGTLTATPTPSDATVTYKWYRSNAKDGTYVVIDGATSNTYTLTDDDFGKYIKVEVKGTGSYTGTKEKVVGPVAASEAAITEALEAVNNYLLAYNYSDHYSEAPGKLEPHLATLGLNGTRGQVVCPTVV